VLHPLPKPSVDTGMGLERLAAVMQAVHSNYEIDLFQHIIAAVAALAGLKEHQDASLRVIADHIRACSFLIADGVVPSNEGRGYVLRRIIRRAIRHGHKLGLPQPFFYRLAAEVEAQMGDAHPELRQARDMVARVLKQEEERFAETLDHGMRLLEEHIAQMTDKRLPGAVVFKLYDTYGFPVDLTADIARERGFELDMAGFEAEMAAQRERARAASHFEAHWEKLEDLGLTTEFTGYSEMRRESCKIMALLRDGQAVENLQAGEAGQVVLDKTPFYAESGGQVGDKGSLQGNGTFDVQDTQKLGQAHVHIGVLQQGALRVGDMVSAEVSDSARRSTMRNHSATHLLHAALRQILGDHVKQKGSLVEPDRLRFDFAHFEPIRGEQLQHIERLVNQQILLNTQVQTRVMALDDAMQSGAMALFGEKYGDAVRVLSIGDFSTELCGGTHVNQAGDIGLFKITVETGVAAGVRRIEAITGTRTLDWVETMDQRLARLSGLLKADRGSLESKVEQVLEQLRGAEKELERLQGKLASAQGNDLAGQAKEINGMKVLAAKLEGADAKRLRDTLDQLKNKLGSAVILLAAAEGEKVSLVAGVTADLTSRVKAGELVNFVAQQVGGKGGGRPDMAQAGGNQPANLAAALHSVAEWVGQR
jgi:alanyl-tRNA synthetase